MEAFGVTSSVSHPDRLRMRSLDSGIYMRLAVSCDESLPSSELEEADEDKHISDRDGDVELQPEEQNHSGDSSEKDDGVKLGPDRDPEELKVSSSAVAPEAGAVLAGPPPLPPKSHKKPPAPENPGSGPGPGPGPGPSPGSGPGPDVTTGKLPEHNSCTLETKTDSNLSLSPKPPEKPPRRNKPNRAEAEDGQQTRPRAADRRAARIPPPPPPKPGKRLVEEALRDGAAHGREPPDQGGGDASAAEPMGPELPETQTLRHPEPQDEADGQADPGPGPLDATEQLQTSVEDAQETGDTAEERRLQPTSQKPSAGGWIRGLHRRLAGCLKDGRKEKRRTRTGEVDPAAVTEEETRRWEDEGVEQERTDEGSRRRHEASERPFGSFKVYSPRQLLEELQSSQEWSRFLNASPGSPPAQTQPEGTVRLSSSPGVLSPGELQGCVAPELESGYEDVDTSAFRSEGRAEPAELGLDASDIYETVELMQPATPHKDSCTSFTVLQRHEVLDSSVQKYRIKLNKQRKHKLGKRRLGRRQRLSDVLQPSPSSVSQIFTTSIFYHVPPEEEQLTAMVSTGISASDPVYQH